MVDLSSSKPSKPGEDSLTSLSENDQPLTSNLPPNQPLEEKPVEAADKSAPSPLKDEEKMVTDKQKEIEKELSEIGISPKHTSKKTKIVMAALGVLLLIATLPAAVYLVKQRQEIRKEAANTGWFGTSPNCTGNCDITIGPGNFGFETGGMGTPDVQNPNTEKSVSINIPSGTTVHEAYIFWSGECDPGKNDTSIIVNGVDTNANKTFTWPNARYTGAFEQFANLAKIPESAIKQKSDKITFNVKDFNKVRADGIHNHGIGIVVVYTGQNVGYNSITLKLWGAWLYFSPHIPDQKMTFDFPDLDMNRAADNKFAFFFGEGERLWSDHLFDANSPAGFICASIEGGGGGESQIAQIRPSHLLYQIPESNLPGEPWQKVGNWTVWESIECAQAAKKCLTPIKAGKCRGGIYPATGSNGVCWPACPVDQPPTAPPPPLNYGWWAIRTTGKDLNPITLNSSKKLEVVADSYVLEGDMVDWAAIGGDSYTWVGAVAQYPVETAYQCWSECSQQSDCDAAGLTCDTPPGDTVKRCLNSECPSAQTCVCPVTTCLDLTAEPAEATLKKGDEVEFTCQGSGSNTIHHFEFRLRKDGGSWQDLGTITATKVGENYEAKVDYEVSATGSYRAECRVCTSSDSTSCTQWGATQ